MGQTIAEKIAQQHMTAGPTRPLRAGDAVSLRPRHILTHDNTAAVMKKFKGIGAERIHAPRQPVFVLDHDIQNKSETNLSKYREIEEFAREQGVDFYPAGNGISHQIMMEQGYVVPGALVVGSDSHSNMYGALGALGTPVVRTDAAAIWATGEFWWQLPRSIRVTLSGELAPDSSGKDVILTLCGLYNQGEVLNSVVEFSGPGVTGLSVDARMTIANMTTEWGALAGCFPVDELTLNYLRDRIQHHGDKRYSEEDLGRWAKNPPAADPDAVYAAEIEFDLAEVTPHVSGPDSVQVTQSLAEIQKERIPIQKAYLVSCVNSRFEDLESAAAAIKGRKVANGVEFYVAAASKEVQQQAMVSGAWGELMSAGAQALPPGCGPCIGLGTGLLEAGEIGISATNRNFKGRMGSRDAKAYLASPAVVAASAAAGEITGVALSEDRQPERHYSCATLEIAKGETQKIMDGFPEVLRGRLVFVPQNNLNTDGIYGKDYTYREDMTTELMAEVVMANYDPEFAAKTQAGDILVGGFNFGTGSSREQAATALQAKGITLVIAGSFSQTYLRNAYNNGLLCIECPQFVKELATDWSARIDAKELTIIPGSTLEVDFARSSIALEHIRYQFAPLGSVQQSLIVAGGVENLVRMQLSDAPGNL